jgi:hypothetical protein
MLKISNHTLLINCVIGFSKRIQGWPDFLRNRGYWVELIEPRFILSSFEKINPDIMFSSNRLTHSLVAECKGGTSLEEGQLRKYGQLDVAAVRPRVSLAEPDRMTIDSVFVCLEGAEDQLAASMSTIQIFPILVVGKKTVRLVNHFSKGELNTVLAEPLDVDTPPPVSFYPFGDEDDADYIAAFVFQELVSIAAQRKPQPEEIDADSMLAAIHPLWDSVDDSKKKKLRDKVNAILLHYSTRDLRGYLGRVRGRSSWRIVKTLQAFSREVEKVRRDLEEQRTLDVS